MTSFSLLVFTLFPVLPVWQTFSNVEGGFEVESPGVMQHNIQQIQTDLGEIDYHTFYLSTQNDKKGNFFFQISYYQSDALEMPLDSTELISDFFAATVEQAAMSLSGEVLILDEIKFQNKFPGRFWRIHYNGGKTVMKTKAYLVNNRFYSIQVAVDADFSLDKDIDRFIDSFKLINLSN
ncbi:MAG: hypothetical protein KDC53_04100 [Saprospiraceae bacterium]|nr:hypothetical protein [Saprospiraceae bacterium]